MTEQQITWDELAYENTALEAEVERLKQWINDLQAGTYITCVYCGHNYGPDDEVPTCMADVLKAHIEQCPQHPMSALKTKVESLGATLRRISAFHIPGDYCREQATHALCGTDSNGEPPADNGGM